MFTATIPILDWVLAAFGIYLTFRLTLREAFLVGATLATAWLVLGTEFLSLCHAITFTPVLLWWLVPLPFAVFLVIANRQRRRAIPRRPQLSVFDYFLLAAIV